MNIYVLFNTIKKNKIIINLIFKKCIYNRTKMRNDDYESKCNCKEIIYLP